jgi:hypothetical protein
MDLQRGEASVSTEDAIYALSRAIRDLGNADASTPMGGVQALALEVKEGSERMANGLEAIAESIDRLGGAVPEFDGGEDS